MFSVGIQIILTAAWVYFGLIPTLRFLQLYLDFLRNSLGFGKAALELEKILRCLIFNIEDLSVNKTGDYKFYHKLIDQLLEQKIQLGIDIIAPLQELLNSLSKDRSFILRVRAQFENSIVQFSAISLMTWVFNFFMQYLLALHLNFYELGFIALLQSLGLISFLVFFYWRHQKKFKNYAEFFELFYVCRSLWSANLPINQIACRLSQITITSQKRFSEHIHKYEQLMELGQRYGTVEDKDFNALVNGLWGSLEWDFEQFVKGLIPLKFFHLVFFFVPSYFLLLYFLLQRLQL